MKRCQICEQMIYIYLEIQLGNGPQLLRVIHHLRRFIKVLDDLHEIGGVVSIVKKETSNDQMSLATFGVVFEKRVCSQLYPIVDEAK
jgi:hypothetical protein